MTRFGWLVLLIVLLVLAGIIGGWYALMRYHPPAPAEPAVATSTEPSPDLSTSSIYTNGVYGFSFIYPGADTVSNAFTPWRSGATATGTPIVSLADKDGMMRIGASTNAKELKACTKAGPAEAALADLTLGSTTFKGFTHDDLGTDNQLRITSYRAIHEKACVALEVFQPLVNGSTASSTRLTGIVQSFTFVRP